MEEENVGIVFSTVFGAVFDAALIQGGKALACFSHDIPRSGKKTILPDGDDQGKWFANQGWWTTK